MENESQERQDDTHISWPPAHSAMEDASGSLLSHAPTSSSIRRTQSYTTSTSFDETRSMYSDTSSIARFPTFHFDIRALTPLMAFTRLSRKTNVLVAILEIEPARAVKLKNKKPKAPKKGLERFQDEGEEVSVLNMIVGDADGSIARVTAWRAVAEEWSTTVRRGDVVHIHSKSQKNFGAQCNALTRCPRRDWFLRWKIFAHTDCFAVHETRFDGVLQDAEFRRH